MVLSFVSITEKAYEILSTTCYKPPMQLDRDAPIAYQDAFKML